LASYTIHHDGKVWPVSVARSDAELREAQALDDAELGGFKGITWEELVQIRQEGFVFLLRDETSGKLLAQSQLLLSSIKEQEVGANDACCYGTVGRGYGQILFKAQEKAARQAGKTRMWLTVRVENTRSIRARLKAGFRITAYDRDHYGPRDSDGARLIMEKDLVDEPLPFAPKEQLDRLRRGETTTLGDDQGFSSLEEYPVEVAIPVFSSSSAQEPRVDFRAHDALEQTLASGYVGVGLLLPSELGRKTGKSALFILRRRVVMPSNRCP